MTDMITLINDDSIVKFTPAINGRMWFDKYQNGSLHTTMAVPTDAVDDLVMDLMHSGYYME